LRRVLAVRVVVRAVADTVLLVAVVLELVAVVVLELVVVVVLLVVVVVLGAAVVVVVVVTTGATTTAAGGPVDPDVPPASFTRATVRATSESAITATAAITYGRQRGASAKRVRAAVPQFRHQSCSARSGAPHNGH
jgi:glucan phosphoethanolaminetransferase (alkaline phosphatase superfamily)